MIAKKLFVFKLPIIFLYGFIKSFFHRRKKMTDPIDFVVLWVDDHDVQWQQEKAKYAQMENKSVMIHNNAERYRDWDLFRYWFRAVEKYAPWVNKVYLVTCGHVPAWLNLDNPKLVHVKHEDFIPKEYLPTFNCNPIETNLHRIPGLSEHFVYFNDDTILTKPVLPEDFFQAGRPLVCSGANPVVSESENDAFSHILFSVTGLLNRYDWRKVIENNPEKWFSYRNGSRLVYSLETYLHHFLLGIFYPHMPQAMRKSTYEKVWSVFGDRLNETCTHKLRTPTDINQQIFTGYEIVLGDYVPMKRHHYGIVYPKLSISYEECADDIRKQRYRMTCINDAPDITVDNFEKIRNKIAAAFEETLHTKCSFEKDD